VHQQTIPATAPKYVVPQIPCYSLRFVIPEDNAAVAIGYVQTDLQVLRDAAKDLRIVYAHGCS
jgi:hypothetical protein